MASSNGRDVEEAGTVACGRRVMLRLIRAAEIARAEDVERHVADERRRPVSPRKSMPAEREVDLGSARDGSTDQASHPVAPELVAVAVEEDVVLLLDRQRPEEVGVGAPEDGLGPSRAELAQPLQAALRVGDDEVVLRRIGAVVVVEARVHAAELRQAHRHVAVVEDDRHVEALTQLGRDAAEVRTSGR